VLLQEGAANDALSQLFSEIPAEPDEERELTAPIDLNAVLPAGSASVQYDGSLTTPPCTEGVRWNVFLTPATVSAAQLAAFTAVYPDNNRPVQGLHGREVAKVTE